MAGIGLAAGEQRDRPQKGLDGLFPLARGPADVTDRMAGDFKTKYGKGVFTRKRKVKQGEKAPEHRRTAKSLDSRVRTLKAAFAWFLSLRLVEANPFEKVTPPELDRHEVKYVRPADVEELSEGDPHVVALENARRKRAAVDGEHVLAVDTLVALDGVIYGKPGTEEEARATLTALAGRTHEVISGLVLDDRATIAVTKVHFRPLQEDLLDWYVAGGEWRERAGSRLEEIQLIATDASAMDSISTRSAPFS